VLGADGGVLARLEVGELGEQRRDVGDDAERSRSRAPAWSIRSIALSGSTRSGRYRALSSTAARIASSVYSTAWCCS
jgi:hypothetical protein